MELVVRVRLFDRVEVLALDVLDERDLQGVAVVVISLMTAGRAVEAGLLRGAEAALAGDQPVAVVADAGDHKRLDDPVLAELRARSSIEASLKVLRGW